MSKVHLVNLELQDKMEQVMKKMGRQVVQHPAVNPVSRLEDHQEQLLKKLQSNKHKAITKNAAENFISMKVVKLFFMTLFYMP